LDGASITSMAVQLAAIGLGLLSAAASITTLIYVKRFTSSLIADLPTAMQDGLASLEKHGAWRDVISQAIAVTPQLIEGGSRLLVGIQELATYLHRIGGATRLLTPPTPSGTKSRKPPEHVDILQHLAELPAKERAALAHALLDGIPKEEEPANRPIRRTRRVSQDSLDSAIARSNQPPPTSD